MDFARQPGAEAVRSRAQQSRAEQWLNRFARPEVRLAGRAVCSFHVCGVTGFSLAVATALFLDFKLGLSGWVTLAIAASGALTFLALAMTVKVLTGRETLTYYHHEIAVVSAAAALLHFLRVPPGSYLDQTVLGVGEMLMCGRIGCLMVGCCHGRPTAWGIRYREEHARAGFPHWLVGVALFPVQLLESVCLLGILGTTGWLVLTHAPGTGLAFYVAAYALLRFGMEMLRGDVTRPSFAGFSEAQWTSLGLCVAAGTVFVGCRWIAVLLALVMIFTAARRRLRGDQRRRLLEPRHVREVAEALGRAEHACEGAVRVEATSLGIRLSCGEIVPAGELARHYALSCSQAELNRSLAHAMAGLVLRLRHPPSARPQLMTGRDGVFHLVVPEAPKSHAR